MITACRVYPELPFVLVFLACRLYLAEIAIEESIASEKASHVRSSAHSNLASKSAPDHRFCIEVNLGAQISSAPSFRRCLMISRDIFSVGF